MTTNRDRHAWLKSALADKGLRQKDIAELWSCDEAVVSRFVKTGEPALSFDRAQSLSKKLGMTLDELTVRLAEGLAPRRSGPRSIAPAVAAASSGGDDVSSAMAEAKASVQRLRELLPDATITFQINLGD